MCTRYKDTLASRSRPANREGCGERNYCGSGPVTTGRSAAREHRSGVAFAGSGGAARQLWRQPLQRKSLSVIGSGVSTGYLWPCSPCPGGGGGGGGKATISTVVVTNRRLGLVVSGLVGGVTVGKPFFLPFPLATRIGKLHKRVSCTLCSGVATNTSRKTIHTLGDSDASDYFFDG